MPFLVLNKPNEVLYEIKRSKFHAFAQGVKSRDEAMQVIESRRSVYPDARHHCWAYLLGFPDQPISMAMNDDGEPSGTAGKPMLNVLQHSEVGNIVVVISRYFGGVKLGAGGLVRAYSSATQLALNNIDASPFVEMRYFQLVCQYDNEQFVRHLLSLVDASVDTFDYALDVTLTCAIPQTNIDTFSTMCDSHQLVYKLLDT
ncbi:IMPACT family protein [Glaciecola sp. 2405UD65-10]|uniref:IMPACT family protein n=1 Tax=Glaciecola sp. 2405UD65-10 TaxID=3397244 RepID=UPI003B5C30DA